MSAENSRVLPSAAGAAVRAEPSWGRVLATTVRLWLSRRLSRPGFARWRPGAWRRGTWRLAVALVAVVAVTVAALQLAGVFTGSRPRVPAASPAVAARARAASAREAAAARAAAVRTATQTAAGAWIAGQISDSAIIGCFPAMCAGLQAHGIGASQLMPLGPGLAGALSTDVIVISPADGQRRADQDAPALVASFGSGAARIEVRAVWRGGAAAYAAVRQSDFAARESAGSQLLRNSRVNFTAPDAARLRAGQVDARLLATIAMLSTLYTFRVADFDDASPGAQLLFREVTITSDGNGKRAVDFPAALALVNAQNRPYLPARAAIVALPAGQSALRIEFAEPSPLGLLTTVLTDQIRSN